MKPQDRYTKIICTLGPASLSEDMIHKMACRGMNVARINCSHGSHKNHQAMIDLVRKVSIKEKHKIEILMDLEGYRIRMGKFKKPQLLTYNDTVRFCREDNPVDGALPLDYAEELKNILIGHHIYIDDGQIHLRVVSSTSKVVKAKVVQGGLLKERKGVNIPMLKLTGNITTQQDIADIQFGIENKVDKIAQSFVRNKRDIQRVNDMVKDVHPDCLVIAKIENEDGVRNIDSILDECDGIMVARGDLGVTMPIYKIPIIQKYLIRHANRRKKLSMTATQMLDSMIEDGQPTRAEVSDVANAILDGSDYVMLSGETAIGKYPSRSIKLMSQIVAFTERNSNIRPS